MSLPASFLQQRIPLADLLDLKAFEEVCRSFSELYRVGLKVFDEAGNKLVDVKVGNADFCGYIWTKPSGREQCIATVGRVKSQVLAEEAKPVRFECFSGCRYVVEPVLYEGDLMGRVVFGPFVPDDLAELPVALRRISPDFDAKLAEGYQQKIRKVGVASAEKILKHFMGLLDVMIFTGHKNLIASKLHIEAVTESYRELSDKNRQLEESYAKLKELDRLKSNFLATMSHELRTPLTSVIGYSEMMLEGLGGPLTGEQREYLGIIMEKGENLLQLITSILDISKIEAGRVRLVVSEIDAAQIMRDAVATVVPIARKKGVRVACEPSTHPADPRGSGQAPPGAREPLLERGEVHAGRRGDHRRRRGGTGRPGRDPRHRHRHRHRERAHRQGLRRVLPGGRVVDARVRRRRPRPRHREELRRGARRRGGRPLRARGGLGLHGRAAGRRARPRTRRSRRPAGSSTVGP